MRIALDAMGTDRGPAEMAAGAVQAVSESALDVVLFGDTHILTPLLSSRPEFASGRLQVVHTTEVVGMGESPIEAIRRKRDSSIVAAFESLRRGEVDAVVSAGNSGATMAAALRSLGRLSGISRPGIASVFPTLKKPVVMMDVGANVDCRPRHLFQFGVMASAFSEVILDVQRPRVGVLSIGEEQGKGNSLVKKTDDLFRRSSLNYIGNTEGGEIFRGDVDVVVCDGFVGNVCLKISEGLAEALTGLLRVEINKSSMAKAGYFLARGAFANFKKRIDYAEYGGAPLLGLKGTGIVCHGRSNSKAIKNALFVAGSLVQNKVNDRITELLTRDELILADDSDSLDRATAGAA